MASWARVWAIARKDAAEVMRQPGLVLPALALVLGLTLPAFLVMLVTPILDGESLAGSDFAEAAAVASAMTPELGRLAPAGQAQAFLLQQFLLFSLLVPVLGSMSLAAQGVIGEKLSRALEPLLATPLTTTELLLAKVLTPFALSMVLLAANFLLYLVVMATWGEPGVWASLFWPRTLVLYLVVGPLVTFTALMAAAIISSRVNDARTAQQLGGILVIPITGVFIGQLAGQFLFGIGALWITALALVMLDAGLLWLGVRVFRRETILLRWK